MFSISLTFCNLLVNACCICLLCHACIQKCTPCPEKRCHSIFASDFDKYWPIFFQNSFIGRLSRNFMAKQLLNIPSHLQHVATLPCEMFVLKNSHAQGWLKRTPMQDSGVQNSCSKIHRESKGCHPNHDYNFVNSWSICKILSLLQRAVNF